LKQTIRYGQAWQKLGRNLRSKRDGQKKPRQQLLAGQLISNVNFPILKYFLVGQPRRCPSNPLMFETPLPGIDHCRAGLVAGLDGLVVIF